MSLKTGILFYNYDYLGLGEVMIIPGLSERGEETKDIRDNSAINLSGLSAGYKLKNEFLRISCSFYHLLSLREYGLDYPETTWFYSNLFIIDISSTLDIMPSKIVHPFIGIGIGLSIDYLNGGGAGPEFRIPGGIRFLINRRIDLSLESGFMFVGINAPSGVVKGSPLLLSFSFLL